MKTGFIGCGQMATALAVGIAKTNHSETEIAAFDPNEDALERFSDSISAHQGNLIRCQSNQQVIDKSECVFLAVKPQSVEHALRGVHVVDSTLFVSVLAGTTIDRLADLLGTTQIVRTMPNTPCLISKGAIALTAAESVGTEKISFVKSTFAQIGIVVEVTERLMDAVTGLSGSGPAFVFTFLEALTDAGVLSGLSRIDAHRLAVQTVLGAAELVNATGKSPAELKSQVTSPGGTTIHGLEQLEQLGFRAAVNAAVRAATNRSAELGKN